MIFSSISDYYYYLEQDNSIFFDFNVSHALINLRDATPEGEQKDLCSYELFYNDFNIMNGQLGGKLKYSNGEEYPNFTLFKDNLEYIISRADIIVNPKHKAKYNHLLWLSSYRHIRFAKEAINNYLLFFETFNYPLTDNLSNHAFENVFKNLFVISQSANQRKEEILEYFLAILGSKKINGYKEYAIMQFISENGNKIPKAVSQEFFDYATRVIDIKIYPDFTEQYLQLLVSLSQKLSLSQKPYLNSLGDFYLGEAEKTNEPFMAHQFYLQALTPFKKAGNKVKMEETTVLIERVKKNLEFKAHKFEYTDDLFQQWWDRTRLFINELVSKSSSDEIYSYLASSDAIFPNAAVLDEEVRPVMFDLVTVTNFDINRNVSNKQKTGIRPYHLQIQNFALRQLWLVFSLGYKSGKISYTSLINYLKVQTWYGMDFTHINSNGKHEGFDWIELLSPGIQSFFIQTEIDIKTNTNNNGGYILAIDSLVLKFEGLLREFSRQIGAQTLEVKSGETGERISFEKLLENEKLITIIPPDEIAFFKYLFTPEWLNLRNNIAHCFYKATDYSAGTMFLILTALLRLGNFTLTSPT